MQMTARMACSYVRDMESTQIKMYTAVSSSTQLAHGLIDYESKLGKESVAAVTWQPSHFSIMAFAVAQAVSFYTLSIVGLCSFSLGRVALIGTTDVDYQEI